MSHISNSFYQRRLRRSCYMHFHSDDTLAPLENHVHDCTKLRLFNASLSNLSRTYSHKITTNIRTIFVRARTEHLERQHSFLVTSSWSCILICFIREDSIGYITRRMTRRCRERNKRRDSFSRRCGITNPARPRRATKHKQYGAGDRHRAQGVMRRLSQHQHPPRFSNKWTPNT